MIKNYNLTSLLIPSQLPEFIRDDPSYETFVAFIQAYYEWLETDGNITDRSKNILNYTDIDRTTDEFLNYFFNDFLSYFPLDMLADKTQVTKIAKQLYKTKGTPASYRFLFRILYNTDVDFFYTDDVVLRSSNGEWYVPRSLKLASLDEGLLNVNNLRIFGITSKSIATIENSVRAGNKTEIFISNIERLFQSGEYATIVDSHNNPVYFLDGKIVSSDTENAKTIVAKIVGQISSITIDPKNRGSLYEIGDPVIISGGLANTQAYDATAEVGTVTSGSIQNINLLNGGYGYTENTIINITNAPGAYAIVGSFDPNPANTGNVTLFSTDTIALKHNIPIGNSIYHFANNVSANANTKLQNALSFSSFSTYPITSVVLLNGGGGIKKTPVVSAESEYPDDNVDPVSSNNYAFIKSIGMLAPIQILNGGTGYTTNDTIVFTNGSGYGAYANVTNVASNGAITQVSYVSGSKPYPLGGMGYKTSALPKLSVNSSNVLASNANLVVTSVLGDGATFSVITDRVGSVTTINVLDPGEDYSSTPNISLNVMDVLVSNVNIAKLPEKGDIVFQGSNSYTSMHKATVNSISLLIPDSNSANSVYNLRLYDYNKYGFGTPLNPSNGPISVIDKNIVMNFVPLQYDENYNENGVRIYGDGKALARTSFLNGLVIGQGQYISSRGQLSSYDVLQSTNYNGFTYQITLEKEIAKYKKVLLDLLHPSGMQVFGRYTLKSNTHFNTSVEQVVFTGMPLYHYTGTTGSTAEMVGDFTNKSNNVIHFNYLSGANIANFIFANSIIEFKTSHGPNVRSTITNINPSSNSITISDNVWLTYSNVALISANANSNTINILSLTGAFDYVNNGNYSNTSYPLKDIIVTGDIVKIDNNTTKIVSSVDYINSKVILTTPLSNTTTGYVSVNRTVSTNDVTIYGPVGLQYFPELLTEDGFNLITEDGNIIILG